MMTTAWEATNWWQYVVYGSSLINALMALLIYKVKALQVHPMKVVFWIMICDSLCLWMEASYNEICNK